MHIFYYTTLLLLLIQQRFSPICSVLDIVLDTRDLPIQLLFVVHPYVDQKQNCPHGACIPGGEHSLQRNKTQVVGEKHCGESRLGIVFPALLPHLDRTK